MLGVPMEALNKNLDQKTIELCKSKFHRQILTSWIKLHQTDPTEVEEILNEYIILNKHILIENKTIQLNMYGQNNNVLKIAHIIKEDGKSKTIEDMNLNLNMQLSTLGYNSLVSAIPRKWKKNLKARCNQEKIEMAKVRPLTPEVKSDGKMISIHKLTTKKMYQTLVYKKTEEGTAIEKWINRILQGKIGTLIRANSINNRDTAEWQQIFANALLIPEPVIPDPLLFFSHMSIHYYIN